MLMVVNTFLRSLNSASEHGDMAIPIRTYSSATVTRDKHGKKSQINTHCVNDLLPRKHRYQSLLQCGHDYILLRIHAERFRRCFVTRCLFNFA